MQITVVTTREGLKDAARLLDKGKTERVHLDVTEILQSGSSVEEAFGNLNRNVLKLEVNEADIKGNCDATDEEALTLLHILLAKGLVVRGSLSQYLEDTLVFVRNK